MSTLINEYKDAGKRFRLLTARIAKLATPLKEIIFNSGMRDNLLFETGDFVWSRRYFWAAQTLSVLSDEIDAMIQTYKETFTDEVWNGEHKTLFPGTSDTSARYANWRKKMSHQRKLFEREIENLRDLRRFCDREQKDIKGLREWLFSGTSVQESRKAVEQASITVDQGYNIKLLTLVTIFFLPLTFVTSVFGMTNMDPDENFLHFGIVVLAICVPTYFLIGIINYSTFQKCVAYLAWPAIWTVSNIRKSTDWAHRYRNKYMRRISKQNPGHPNGHNKTMTRAQTFASLQHRLSIERSADQELPPTPKENGGIASAEFLPSTTVAGVQRVSTIKWETPASPERVHLPEPSPHTSVPDLLQKSSGMAISEHEAVRPREMPRAETPSKTFLSRFRAKSEPAVAKSPV
jgi:hypothetical protein